MAAGRKTLWRSMQPNILADDCFVTKVLVRKRWGTTSGTKIELTVLP